MTDTADTQRLNLKVEIRRNADSVIATDVWPDLEWGGDYWWSEGNAACDCNRELFFCRARGEAEGQEECGQGRFSVRLSNAATGDVLYDEFKAEE